MIFYEQPTDPWDRFDFILLEAYQILQDETCANCGQPIWLCRSTDSNVNIKIRKATCYVTAAVEKKREADEKNKARKMKPGEYYYPVIETIDGGELPSRNDYFKSLAEIA